MPKSAVQDLILHIHDTELFYASISLLRDQKGSLRDSQGNEMIADNRSSLIIDIIV